MKIATVGKGGSGKTTIAGTLARILAEDGIKVLAIDGDPNPNLALTLGVTRDEADEIKNIPPTLMKVKEDAEGKRELYMTMDKDKLMSEYGISAPGNIKLITMGQPPHGSAGSGCMCASHRAVRGIIGEMTGYGDHTITDMEAGLEHLKRGTVANVDTMLIVAEPYYRSLEAAGRTWSLANELNIPHVYVVANKVRNEQDKAAIEEFCASHNMPTIGFVPAEEQFMEAERQAQAPIDFAPDSDGTKAIREIAVKIRELKQPAVAA